VLSGDPRELIGVLMAPTLVMLDGLPVV